MIIFITDQKKTIFGHELKLRKSESVNFYILLQKIDIL